MALADVINVEAKQGALGLRREALDLARTLPRLAVDARRISSAFSLGLHGRRRPGIGETFWQFRNLNSGEESARVDWRRSARDDRLYVREREWEAAHTVWLWCDRSASMGYQSRFARTSKIERALVLTLALADLLVRGGERVGLIGLARPTAHSAIIERVANAWIADRMKPTGLPQAAPLPAYTEAVLIGDFLSPAAEVAETVASLARQGARGHVLMIADPIEETFPFQGRTELFDPAETIHILAGQAQSLKESYVARLAQHRETILKKLNQLGWTMTLHRTDRPASEAMLSLYPLLRSAVS